MSPLGRALVALAGVFCVAGIVAKLIGVLEAENRRLLSAQVARTPKDFGVLTAQQDGAEHTPDAIERIVKDALPDLDYHLAAMRGDDIDGNEPEPTLPHGL